MKSWKSSSLPLCGVAVISRKWRRDAAEQLAEPVALGVLDLAAEEVADILCASSQTTRSQSVGAEPVLTSSSLRESLSSRAMTQVRLEEPVAGLRAASIISRVRISKARWNCRESSSCHCSARLPGQTIRQRLEVAADDQLLDEEAGHDGLAGAGSSASRKRSGWRGSIAVDGRDLVRQRLDEGRVDREDRVEEVREADALRLGDEAEERAVAVKHGRPPSLTTSRVASSSR